MVKAVFQIPGIKQVPGKPGMIGRISMAMYGVEFDMYADELGLPWYWPTSLQVAVSVKLLSFLGDTQHPLWLQHNA